MFLFIIYNCFPWKNLLISLCYEDLPSLNPQLGSSFKYRKFYGRVGCFEYYDRYNVTKPTLPHCILMLRALF